MTPGNYICHDQLSTLNARELESLQISCRSLVIVTDELRRWGSWSNASKCGLHIFQYSWKNSSDVTYVTPIVMLFPTAKWHTSSPAFTNSNWKLPQCLILSPINLDFCECTCPIIPTPWWPMPNGMGRPPKRLLAQKWLRSTPRYSDPA